MSPRRALATLLVTDIVGSTERAAQVGDREWRALLDRHHAAVRHELRRFGGHEINTAGDSFLASFDDPEAAIRCAFAIRDALRDVGLEIRTGLHMGQIEGAGKEAQGIALHIGSRVASLALTGEVLVSSTVRDALTGSGFVFEDRGGHTLKGVPGDWRLFGVSAPSSAEPSSAVRHRARLAIGAALTLALAAGAILVRQHLGGPGAGGHGTTGSGQREERPGMPGSSAASADDKGEPAPTENAASDAITLAVLPFQTLNAREEIGFLGIGVADAVITTLANASRLRVRPTTSIRRYEDQELDVPQVVKDLQVQYVLTGTLLKSGERLRVNAQLIRGTDGAPMWGQQYELPRGDLLALQDSSARRVAATPPV